jgi:hypothetical protein
MPTDLMVALERKTKLERELKLERCPDALLLPLGICLLTLILVIKSPAFAVAITATGQY